MLNIDDLRTDLLILDDRDLLSFLGGAGGDQAGPDPGPEGT